jgi:type III secretory pathway component EscS
MAEFEFISSDFLIGSAASIIISITLILLAILLLYWVLTYVIKIQRREVKTDYGPGIALSIIAIFLGVSLCAARYTAVDLTALFSGYLNEWIVDALIRFSEGFLLIAGILALIFYLFFNAVAKGKEKKAFAISLSLTLTCIIGLIVIFLAAATGITGLMITYPFLIQLILIGACFALFSGFARFTSSRMTTHVIMPE